MYAIYCEDMIDLNQAQKDILENKKNKGFNTTDIAVEFCLTHEELSEAYRAYYKKLPDLGEELADVAIYLLSIAEITGIDLEKEILAKIEKNKKRKYEVVDGVMTRVSEG
jgi:NTP pyrophosphatase (non-canonical NTP hydrolase)